MTIIKVFGWKVKIIFISDVYRYSCLRLLSKIWKF